MKRLLIVVDFQKDFVDGSLGFEGARLLDNRIAAKIRAYHEEGDVVVYTMDSHNSRYLQSQEGRNLPIEHCIEGTPGWEVYGETGKALLDRDRMFKKNGFGSTKLFEYLAGCQQAANNAAVDPFTSIEVVGLVSNICVLFAATIAKTACPEVPVIVDASCVGAGDASLHEKTLDVLESVQVQVINR